MIKITIEQVVTIKFKETKNFLIKKTPTGYKEPGGQYDRGDKVAYEEINEPREIENERTEKRTLLNQEIEDESAFNLKNVIAAINGMKTVPLSPLTK